MVSCGAALRSAGLGRMSEIAGNDTSRPGPKAPPRSTPSDAPSFAGVEARSMRAAAADAAVAALAKGVGREPEGGRRTRAGAGEGEEGTPLMEKIDTNWVR